jgi:hypothetical protein
MAGFFSSFGFSGGFSGAGCGGCCRAKEQLATKKKDTAKLKTRREHFMDGNTPSCTYQKRKLRRAASYARARASSIGSGCSSRCAQRAIPIATPEIAVRMRRAKKARPPRSAECDVLVGPLPFHYFSLLRCP